MNKLKGLMIVFIYKKRRESERRFEYYKRTGKEVNRTK